ncbi:type II toxin-antitoxin system VapC family toxin [Thiohalophilus sp.]|uniref:type II toxin-antitoxin system VapC family toxin n=1 Tax=Thiohalophilus sp. TaxID=3028392 RepID=UPI003976293F
MNVVDSSGWLEYFADNPNADVFATPILEIDNLIVPSISLLEVFKRVLQQRGQDAALQTVALMKQGQVVPLDETLALKAAKLGLEHKLPLADSVMLATARAFDATLWTQDADFDGIDGVRFIRKKQ